MGTEKTGVKAGGLFHLFDWNKKSRKKLFANGNVSSDVTRGGTKGNDNTQTSRPCLIEDDDSRGLLSVKGSSDHSCASSVTDEEGNGIRAPGVVARLMGLDSLPTASVSEPYSTPLFDSRSLRENSYQKRGSEFDIDNRFSTIARSERYARKPLDLRSQKMPSSPIERFQTEVLPPRSAKSLPVTHYKLLSPIKNPSFVSVVNAACVMEAAAKILEPGLRANAKGKAHSLGSSSLSLGVRDSKEGIAVSQRLSSLPESSRGPLESNAFKYLKGYSLNKSWNSPEDSVSVRGSPEWGETSSTGAKVRGGKTISLAVQAKVNVQRREGSTTSNRRILVHREQDETKTNQPFKGQQGFKNKPRKNASAPGPSGVLKQNNQKQNCLSNRDKATAKSSMSSQQGKKVPSGDGNHRKDRILNKIHGGSKVGYRKEDLQVTDLERDGSSSRTKNVPRKKRLIDRNHQSDSDTILVGNHEKHVQSCVMKDENRKWDECSRRNGTDIVSFTFKSPMIKSTAGSQSTHIMKRHNISSFSVVMEGESNGADPKDSRLSSGLNVISGDALSVLLEQKLRELTSGLQSSSSNMGKVGNASPSAFYPDLLSAYGNSHAASVEHEKEPSQGPCNGSICNVSDDLFSVNGRLSNLCTKLRGEEGTAECSSSGSDAQKEPEQRHPSPLSILEASFSSECCSSSDSSNSNNGSKICSSVDTHSYIGLNCKDSAGEAGTDLLDSASSMCAETANEECASGIASPTEIPRLEMEYVRDIIQISGIDFMDMASGGLNHNLDHLYFDLLENKKTSSSNGPVDKNHRLWRKMLFDCVRECLESKCSRFFKAGCRSWAKGIAMIGREDEFAGEIYKEISRWKGVGDWMADELVDKDMSSNLGRWIDFEVEEFEAGVEIEKAILSCVIDEVVADFI